MPNLEMHIYGNGVARPTALKDRDGRRRSARGRTASSTGSAISASCKPGVETKAAQDVAAHVAAPTSTSSTDSVGAYPLEAESLALTLVQRALGPRTTHAPGASVGRQRLVDRAKLVLASDLARRWTLAEIAAEVGGSPVYLTQVFQQVEGCRSIATSCACGWRARWICSPQYDDLTALGPRPRLLQPQPFQRRLPRGLRPLALRVPALKSAGARAADR